MATQRWVLVVGIGLVAGACSPPRVDNTSVAMCRSSLEQVARASADSTAFAQAMVGIVGSAAMQAIGDAFGSLSLGFEEGPTVEPPATDSVDMFVAMCDVMVGMTGEEIVARRDSLAAAVSVRMEEARARAHLRALQEARSAFDQAEDSLTAFQVLSAALEQESGIFGMEATIRLRVRNGTPHPVSRAYFTARAVSPGRSVPWLEEEFNHSIAGGLEPSEERTWNLQPNMFQGDWTSVRVPKDARFEVRVVRLNGADGEPLFGGARFTAADQVRLDSLEARFVN